MLPINIIVKYYCPVYSYLFISDNTHFELKNTTKQSPPQNNQQEKNKQTKE